MTYTAVFGGSERVKTFFGVRKSTGLSTIGFEVYQYETVCGTVAVRHVSNQDISTKVDVAYSDAACFIFLDSADTDADQKRFVEVCKKAAEQYLPVIRVSVQSEKAKVTIESHLPSAASDEKVGSPLCYSDVSASEAPAIVARLAAAALSTRVAYVAALKSDAPVVVEKAKAGYFAELKQKFNEIFTGVSAKLSGFFGRSSVSKSVSFEKVQQKQAVMGVDIADVPVVEAPVMGVFVSTK